MEDSLEFECWRRRDKLLKKDDTPLWKAAALRRGNMNQLFHDWMSNDMEYDMFDYLFDHECEEYEKVMDDEERCKQLEEAVENIVPDFREKIGKFTSSLTHDRLAEIDSVKAAVEHCKLFEEMDEEENKVLEKITISLKEDTTPPTIEPKGPKHSIRKDQNVNNTPCVLPVPPFASSWNSCQGGDSLFGPKPKQLSIYQTVEDGTSSNYQGRRKNTFFEETLKKRRKYEGTPEGSDDSQEMDVEPKKKFHFKSAREQLEIDAKKKNRNRSPQGSFGNTNNASVKKSLGARPRNTCFGKFIPPSIKDHQEPAERDKVRSRNQVGRSNEDEEDSDLDPRLKSIEPKIIELVTNEIMDHGPPIQWDDIAGLEFAKTTIKEIVIWPMLRPDIFTGLRGPPKGILLFGPPGTGKTLIGKCIASQSGATFFSISASSLTSKWVGEGEKMVRALFAVASCHQPAVIFIDEIDSLLSQRCDSEHESSRRIKTEFLVQLDGAATSSDERILVVGATNRPQEIDEAARRRLSKRLYIPLPKADARRQIVESLLQQQSCRLSDKELGKIISGTDGYSGADMANLCREAALGPIRSLQGMDISAINKDDVRPIILEDFLKALLRVRPSVSSKDLDLFVEWNKQFGCCAL